MKLLSQIADLLEKEGLLTDKDYKDGQINAISYDSREVEEASLFFCKGMAFKREFLEKSIENGAIAYISEVDYGNEIGKILVKDVRRAMLVVAAFFYDYPDRKLRTVGVTATKGKSTTCMFIKSIIDKYQESHGKKPCGIISSIITYYGDEEFESDLTTPEALVLYKSLSEAVKNGLEYMVIEISSQALKYDRVNTVHLDLALILNIEKDHISPLEHSSIEDYVESKLKIVDLADNIFYSLDMNHLDELERRIENKNTKTFSIRDKRADYFGVDKEVNAKNQFTINGEDFELDILGAHNIENAMASLAVADYFSIDHETVKKAISQIIIIGRSNVFKTEDDKIIFFVDYAHNALSFEKCYETIEKNFKDYRIISFFGATGGKGINRRKDLVVSAAKYSSKIYIVPDDPYDEPWEKISGEIAFYAKEIGLEYEILDNREEAVKKEFGKTKENTVFFLAGKGQETTQKVMGKKIPINSDLEVSEMLVKEYNEKLNCK